MKTTKRWLLGLLVAAALSACQRDDEVTPIDQNLTSDFAKGAEGWVGGFSDYSTQTDSALMELEAGIAPLPAPLDTAKTGFRLSGHNRSDDLFMFLKRKVTGLSPNGDYHLTFDIDLASPFADSIVGIGGSPALSQYLKAGASGTEPQRKLEGDAYVFNLDKGDQSAAGADALVLGNISTGPGSSTVYRSINRTNAAPFRARANAAGELWLFVGTDSGFEGKTTLYYQTIDVKLRQVL